MAGVSGMKYEGWNISASGGVFTTVSLVTAVKERTEDPEK